MKTQTEKNPQLSRIHENKPDSMATLTPVRRPAEKNKAASKPRERCRLRTVLFTVFCILAHTQTSATDIQIQTGLTPGQTRTVGGVTMVWVPPGQFYMGSPHTEEGREICLDPERLHQVHVPQGFWIGKYEITRAQYYDVMGKNPSRDKSGSQERPVDSVSWHDCQEFLSKFNAETKGEFRLPTEAEWEYACRAGTQTAYSYGNDTKQFGEYGWNLDNSGNKTHPVGQKKPNNWGLYDMHGNVAEWCLDWYKADYTGGTGMELPQWCTSRVCKGGTRSTVVWGCRSASRSGYTQPYQRSHYNGFRIVADKLPANPSPYFRIVTSRPTVQPTTTVHSNQTPQRLLTPIDEILIPFQGHTSASARQDGMGERTPNLLLPQPVPTPQPAEKLYNPPALLNAAFSGKADEVKRLIASKAVVNLKDWANRTPLHLAAMRGDLEVVVALLERGADPTVADNTPVDGKVQHLTPLDWAEALGHERVARVLRAHMRPAE